MNKLGIAIASGVGLGFLIYFLISSIPSIKPTFELGNTHTPAYLADTSDEKLEFVNVCKSICNALNINETLTRSIYDSYVELKAINQTLADEVVKLPEDIYCDNMILNETAYNIDCNDDGDKGDVCKCPDLYSCSVLDRIMVCRR